MLLSKSEFCTVTGREIFIFNGESRLKVVARQDPKGGKFRAHFLTPDGLVDLNLSLKSFQFEFLISAIEELDHTPDIHEWITMMMCANRGFTRGRPSDDNEKEEPY